MSITEMKSRLESLSNKIDPMPEEQKNYILGYMEGVCQMSEKLKETNPTEEA